MLPAGLLAAVIGGVPIGILAWMAVVGAMSSPSALRGAFVVPFDALMRTVVVVVVVSALACVFGWPMGRVIACAGGRARGGWVALLAAPLLMPPYLAYAGWSQARAPGTWLGDALGRLASEGQSWVSVWSGYTLAVVGLALWASPIVGLVVAPALARTERSLRETLLLDARAWRREVVRIASVRVAVLRGALLVGLVALGSAVPMHLAQLDTLSIGTWRGIAASGPEIWWVQVVRVWPVLCTGLVAAWWIARVLAASVRDDAGLDGGAVRGSRVAVGAAVAVWLLAVGVPLTLFASNIAPGVRASLAAIERWWSIGGDDVLDSLGIAASVGVVGVLLACCGSLGASVLIGSGHGARRVLAGSAMVLALCAVVPGILVGVALARLPESGAWVVVLAHAARFGIVAFGAGLLAAAAEPAARREVRATDDSGTLRAWWLACVPAQWPVYAGAGVALGVLSFHEVEASVMLTPPGVGSFAQQTLEHLHFFRVRELAAAVTVTMTIGLTAAVAACGLAWIGWARIGPSRGAGAKSQG